MKYLFYFCLAAMSVVLFAGCKTNKAVVVSYSDLDGEWSVVELNGETLNPKETNQILIIDVVRNNLSGNAGCNRIMGQIEYNDAYKNIIKFPKVAATRMMCQDMSHETALLQALDKVVRFEAIGEAELAKEVAFYGVDNSKLLVIKKVNKDK